ncbi:MAG: CcdC protein domain-containing protein [Candidatus Pristimantibacillus sp.]
MDASSSMMISLVVFVLIMRGQFKGMNRPIKKSGITLLLPILYISTSLLQVMDPNLHIQETQVALSLLLGMMIALPLIFTTNFEVRDNGGTFIKRNKTIFILLMVIFVIRLIFVGFFKGIEPSTLGFMSSLTTFSYVACWRLVSFIKFRSVNGIRTIAANS